MNLHVHWIHTILPLDFPFVSQCWYLIINQKSLITEEEFEYQ